jgi:ligand-binding SRPBCC domain-containing protein
MRFVHQSRISAPPEAVFAFHERPDALQKLVPPWEAVTVVQPPASLLPGSRAVLRMRMGPLQATWEAVHTKYEKGVLFQDRMVRGPFKSWEHTHLMLPDGEGGTVLRDEVTYELPFLLLPGVPLVRFRLRRMFRYRHGVTAAAFTSRLRPA